MITIKFDVIKDGQAKLGMVGGKSPIYIPGPVQPQFSPGRMIYFEGFSVDEKGKQHYMDATVAYRQSCLRVIEYLKRFGYSDYQIYLMLSCIPIEGHIAGIVDVSLADLSPSWLSHAVVFGTTRKDCADHRFNEYRYQMHARRLVYRWIYSTLTSRRLQRPRKWISARAPMSVNEGSYFNLAMKKRHWILVEVSQIGQFVEIVITISLCGCFRY